MASEAQKIAEMLKNAYGVNLAKVMVDVRNCGCPMLGCTGSVEVEEGDYGDLEEEVWCTECTWEGTCHDLLNVRGKVRATTCWWAGGS